MKLETENVQETEASAELIRELMADDVRRGNWLILMHDDDEEAFMQIAFDDHPDGIDLEYRDGAGKPLYHCKRPVLRLEAETALTTATVTAASARACACSSRRTTTRRRKSWRCNVANVEVLP